MPLHIDVPAGETYGTIDPETGRRMFIKTKPVTLVLEHSLLSLAKWEEKWHKPYIGTEKTDEETRDYIRCMTISQNVDPNVYKVLTSENINDIVNYIEDPHTATTVREDPHAPKGREKITAELLYYWMISYNIPIDICQKWHLNKLIMLIKVFNAKNAPPKKMTAAESQAAAIRRNALNDARRQKYHSKG